MTVKKSDVQKVPKETPDLAKELVVKLEAVVPEAFSEGKIDFEKLRNSLGDFAETRAERYFFTWAGKKDAIRILQTPSRATLVPALGESVNFDKTQNLFLEGDNLEVLKLLYTSYFGKVKMIYIDPPYNTGGDFIYPDNYSDPLETYLEISGQKSAEGNLLTSNPETSGRYHSSWLSMTYPRLFVARQLLREDGVIFVSIDDHEVHNLRMIMNEIFGEENFVAQIVVKSNPGGRDYGGIALTHEYVIAYSKTSDSELNQLQKTEEPECEDELGKFEIRELRNRNIKFNDKNRPNLHYPFYVNTASKDSNELYEVSLTPQKNYVEVWPLESQRVKTVWRWGKEKVSKNINSDVKAKKKKDGQFQIIEKYRSNLKRARSIFEDSDFRNEQGTLAIKELFNGKPFDYPKSDILIKQLINLGADEDSVILDFFAGSGTTAQAVLDLNTEDGGNRKFILVQLPEPTPEDSDARKAGYKTVADICKERIRRVIKKVKEERKQQKLEGKEGLDLGFNVFKLAESNYRSWQGVATKDSEDYAKQMALFADPLVKGWKLENVLWEVAIKEGYSLTSRIEAVKEIKSNKVFLVSDEEKGAFRICLDDELKPSTLKELGLKKDDLFICRDVALEDEQAANLALQCRLKTI